MQNHDNANVKMEIYSNYFKPFKWKASETMSIYSNVCSIQFMLFKNRDIS